jgi:Transmembrane secretion effector
VEFFFNFFYMPIEVALPLYVRGTLNADAVGLGLMWGALGVGAFVGAALVNQLRNLPQWTKASGRRRFWRSGPEFAPAGRFDGGVNTPLETLRCRGLSRRSLPNSFERNLAASGPDDVEDSAHRTLTIRS